MSDVLSFIGQYRALFLILFEILVILILGIVLRSLFVKWKKYLDKEKEPENKLRLSSGFTGEIDETERQNVIREVLASDGVDPNPNHYLPISDGGREYYARCVTLSKLPKNVRYAETLKPLFMFPDCTSTVFVDPISDQEIGRMIDKQINVLESERISNAGNTNHVRKLTTQVHDAEEQADKVERDGKRFFYVGFLFVFVAETVEQLNNKTDDFRAIAINKKMDISNCYGVQPEAYLASMPFNRRGAGVFKKINSDCVKMHLMDQEALSVILNYTTDHFTHKKGIPLGRNLFNGQPFIFDLFDPSHDGYTGIICGKTNSGKTATIIMMIERFIPLGYRFVMIDSQTRKGTSEGEYATVAVVNGGVNYQISSKDSNVINIFDVQESVELVKESSDSGYERRTLDLNGAITDMLYNLRSMMQINSSESDVKMDAVMDSDINEILTDVIKEMFEERGIFHGDAESLYEQSDVVRDGILQSGVVPKKLPTMNECYRKILVKRKESREPAMEGAFRLIVNNLKEYVRELYYVEEPLLFLTKEQYLSLPENPEKPGQRYATLSSGERVNVKTHFGIRPYFDGQSTIAISRDCPATNIDISQLPEQERKVAREIATRFMNEQFIKKNSERVGASDKIVGIVDEAHEEFQYTYGRKTFENIVRTARKRRAGMIFSTQTVAEFLRYDETKDILKQAAVKMVMKQDAQDSEEIKKALNITDSQVGIITNTLGVVTDKDDPQAGTKHRGEMCVVDGEQCLFVKVDLIRRTEGLAVEHDASQVMRIRRVG